MSKITGDGFNRGEFSEEERAQHREMFREFSDQYPLARPFFNALRTAKSMGYTFGVLAALGGGVAWMVKAGWFQ